MTWFTESGITLSCSFVLTIEITKGHFSPLESSDTLPDGHDASSENTIPR
jgi:hypothetical protein